jgi:Domain of unknown function (DUF4175)
MTEFDRNPALKRLRWPLRLTHAGLWAERITRAFWPLWSVAAATLSFLAFGLQDVLAIELVWFAIVAAVLGGIWAAIHGFMAFHAPSLNDALERLDARLPGQPIAALRDTQAIGSTDPASQAVWAAHLDRMAARAAAAKTVAPNLQLASRDRFALRYVAMTALILALMFGSLWRVTSTSAIMPGGGAAQAAAGPTWEGWAQPPAYTGKPSLYLNEIAEGKLPHRSAPGLRGDPGFHGHQVRHRHNWRHGRAHMGYRRDPRQGPDHHRDRRDRT